MKATWWIVLTILTILVSANAGAVVLSGPLEGVPESRGLLVWGDGHNDLFQQWSAFHPDHGAWFYGSSYGTSNADVYFFPSFYLSPALFIACKKAFLNASTGTSLTPAGTVKVIR